MNLSCDIHVYLRALLSVSRGIELYLYMTQVDLDGNPRRLFLCTYYMNEMCMTTLHVDNPI